MSYKFAEHLLLRMPAYHTGTYHTHPGILLRETFFQAALYVASPVFYSRLAEANFDYDGLSVKEQATVMKYINRCCYRPTPFGLFASVSVVVWGSQEIITVPNNSLTGIFIPDETFVQSAAKRLQNSFGSEAAYVANPTVYRVMKDIRFIRTEINEDGKRTYHLQSTDYSLILKALLRFCWEPKTPTLIIQYIGQLANTDREESADYFQFLSDSQVLIPRLRPNISGDNYLAVLLAGLTEIRVVNEKATQIIAQLPQPGLSVENILKYKARLQTIAGNGERDAPDQPASCISMRKIIRPELDNEHKTTISLGLHALNSLCPPDELPALQQFKNAFRKDFEGQRIPLLAALDPEKGIGYEAAAVESPNRLLETLHIHPTRAISHQDTWTEAHAYLMESWLNMERKHEAVIRLNEADLAQISHRKEPEISLGLTVLFRVIQDKVYMESVGGNNPLALMGRFTAANADFTAAAQAIVKDQELLNPNLIFAELLQLADPHIDNVNRRAHLWSFELPITAASTLPVEKQLKLEDLYVEMEGDTVFLYSAPHGKYVIPRLSSAYNHSLNKLPLFRFLADLPYQFGRTNLSFDLRHYFPGQSFYPRVEIQKAILSLATWIIPQTHLNALQLAQDEEFQVLFRRVVKDYSLPDRFMISDGDQQLVFYRESPDDILLFKEVIRLRKELIISEFIDDLGKDATVRDEKGNAFVNQFNTFILPDRPLPLPDHKERVCRSRREVRKYMPGTEWLYLKIYCPKLNASKILLKIWPLINRKFKHGRSSKWFFIRYDDHAPHIRLRIKLDPRDTGEVLMSFRRLLEGHIDQHVIREYQVDVYSRELERYQSAGMEVTEDLFWSSSLFVLQYLRKSKGRIMPPVYLVALASVKLIIAEIIPDETAQMEFFHECYHSMSAVYDNRETKKQLDLKYRELSKEINQAIPDADFLSTNQLATVSRQLQKHATEIRKFLAGTEAERHDYLHSILHMHINRIFTDQQPQQEMVIYYLLYKYLASQAGRRKQTEIKVSGLI
ncbi:lantibiotic dehydratase [Mucilaginibacter aquariorum]|uniref:Lantibiotic dehydratase n=1 Tax=Mucilaginibacter aquariorum TaxID=2967225 RepID=A0ABT1T220_9SPHI|nr:lantibiotic dehydratase [Mucilaginibacter aquariorum]MCQ6958326.1 lantibiotic dehydratase [Mucilaginibacter aquariorum]